MIRILLSAILSLTIICISSCVLQLNKRTDLEITHREITITAASIPTNAHVVIKSFMSSAQMRNNNPVDSVTTEVGFTPVSTTVTIPNELVSYVFFEIDGYDDYRATISPQIDTYDITAEMEMTKELQFQRLLLDIDIVDYTEKTIADCVKFCGVIREHITANSSNITAISEKLKTKLNLLLVDHPEIKETSLFDMLNWFIGNEYVLKPNSAHSRSSADLGEGVLTPLDMVTSLENKLLGK